MFNRDGLYVTPERAGIVRQEIADGSEPGIRFYILVVISTMIAGFGLAMNSTAVIIGAMLVAPLMTPIFGMALALIRSDAHLLGQATRAEIAGIVAAILMGVVLGKLYPALEPTPEMLARTQPQLFDLLVAIFSGFAGAYALVDEKISPALPGVAIATAIVPPLSNTGLCLALGAYSQVAQPADTTETVRFRVEPAAGNQHPPDFPVVHLSGISKSIPPPRPPCTPASTRVACT